MISFLYWLFYSFLGDCSILSKLVFYNKNKSASYPLHPFPFPFPCPSNHESCPAVNSEICKRMCPFSSFSPATSLSLPSAHRNRNPKITAAIADSMLGEYNFGLSLTSPGAALVPLPEDPFCVSVVPPWPPAPPLPLCPPCPLELHPPDGQILAVEFLAGVAIGAGATLHPSKGQGLPAFF